MIFDSGFPAVAKGKISRQFPQAHLSAFQHSLEVEKVYSIILLPFFCGH